MNIHSFSQEFHFRQEKFDFLNECSKIFTQYPIMKMISTIF